MHPSVNYDYLIHDDHIHWCNVEAQGISRCEELAMGEHSAMLATDPLADIGLSLVIAILLTIIAGLSWGVKRRTAGCNRQDAAAKGLFYALGTGA